jgi:hypothetical protein
VKLVQLPVFSGNGASASFSSVIQKDSMNAHFSDYTWMPGVY